MARSKVQTGASCLLAITLIASVLQSLAAASPPASQPATRPAEKWVSRPPAQWPQILLTHQAKFRGNRDLEGASAFLARLDSGRILAVTAKHLLGADAGVEPPIKLAELNGAVISWTLHTRVARTPLVLLDKLAISPDNEGAHDVLALTLKSINPPFQALKIRAEPLAKGEKVYLIGVPYSEERTRQNAYAGEVLTVHPRQLVFSIKPAVVTRGFSGAPVIDAGGYLVGIYGGNVKKDGNGATTEGAADPTAVLLQLLTVK